MIKEREAGKSRRAFKIIPRGYIGYLVGYYATNIYHIWVPQLNRVIITRNIMFNKEILYAPKQEKEEGQPLKILQTIVEEIDKSRELQDTKAALINLDLVEIPELERVPTSLVAQDCIEEQPKERNSGVRALNKAAKHIAILENIGLPSPKATPNISIGEYTLDLPSSRDKGVVPSIPSSRDESSRAVAEFLDRDTRCHPKVIIQKKSKPQILGSAQSQFAAPRAEAMYPGSLNQRRVETKERKIETKSLTNYILSSTLDPTIKPKRKYKYKNYSAATYISRRIQEQKNNLGKSEGLGGVYLILRMLSLQSYLNNQLNLFSNTFQPTLDLGAPELDFRTIYIVFAALVLQNQAVQPHIIRITPNMHISKLPKAPSNQKELEKHLYSNLFIIDAELKITNLEA